MVIWIQSELARTKSIAETRSINFGRALLRFDFFLLSFLHKINERYYCTFDIASFVSKSRTHLFSIKLYNILACCAFNTLLQTPHFNKNTQSPLHSYLTPHSITHLKPHNVYNNGFWWKTRRKQAWRRQERARYISSTHVKHSPSRKHSRD